MKTKHVLSMCGRWLCAIVLAAAAVLVTAACDNGTTSTTTTTFTVKFVTNGGTAVDNQTVAEDGKVDAVICTKSGYVLAGWFTTSTFTADSEWDFDNDLVTTDMTLYAKWKQNGSSLTTIAETTAALAAATSQPVTLVVDIDLGNMGTGGVWEKLLKALKTANKKVDLDLSACDIGTTAFDPRLATNADAIAGKGKIVSITLPDSVTSISNGTSDNAAFKGFTSLKSFSAANLTTIGDDAFQYCTSLALTSLPAGVTSIGDEAFDGCTSLALTSLPAGLTSIGDYAFYNCSSLALTSLPDGVTSIGNGTFIDCGNLALTLLPSNVISIGDEAFSGCTSLALTALPTGVTSINDYTFYGCSSLALTALPTGVTSIGNYAFSECTSLASIELPSGVTNIGNEAFSNCTSLATVTCHATTPPTLGDEVFTAAYASLKIYVPAGSESAYQADWSSYASKIDTIP